MLRIKSTSDHGYIIIVFNNRIISFDNRSMILYYTLILKTKLITIENVVLTIYIICYLRKICTTKYVCNRSKASSET